MSIQPETSDDTKNIDSVEQYVDNSDFVGKLIDNKPIVDEENIEAVDNFNKNNDDTFDPTIHQVNTDGTPSMTKTGKYRKKRKSKNGGNDIDEYKSLGTLTAVTLTSILSVLNDEFAPKKVPDEIESLSAAFARYYESKDIKEINPTMELGITLAGYVIPRFTMPKTQTWFGKLKKRVRVFMSRFM